MGQSAQGFLPPTCAKSLKTFEYLLHFFRFILAPETSPLSRFSRKMLLRKEVLFAGEKIKFHFNI